MKAPIYSKVGLRPVKSIKDPQTGNLYILAYNWQTGEFEPAMKYLDQLYLGNDMDVTILTENQFDEYVAELEKERLAG